MKKIPSALTASLSADGFLALEAVQHKATLSRTRAVHRLLAKALKAELLEAGIDPFFLEGTPDQIFAMYWQWSDIQLSGENSAYRLETPPQDGFWEAEGVTGYQVLDEMTTFTSDGYTRKCSTTARSLLPLNLAWSEVAAG